MIVGVQRVLFELRMAGNMNLRNTVGVNRIDVFHRVETMVLRRDVDIVHVQQYAAVGGVDNLVKNLLLGHLGLVKLGVAADVFNRNGYLEELLHFANTCSRCAHSLESVGQRK